MKKLEDIPKKQAFTTPDGYFDKLPGRIQARIDAGQKSQWSWSWSVSVRYALSAAVVVVALVIWLRPAAPGIEEQLSLIDADQIALYLDDADVTSEEMADEVDWSREDLDALEQEVYFNMDNSGLDEIIDDIDLENL